MTRSLAKLTGCGTRQQKAKDEDKSVDAVGILISPTIVDSGDSFKRQISDLLPRPEIT
jgi:hypothetical protein